MESIVTDRKLELMLTGAWILLMMGIVLGIYRAWFLIGWRVPTLYNVSAVIALIVFLVVYPVLADGLRNKMFPAIELPEAA